MEETMGKNNGGVRTRAPAELEELRARLEGIGDRMVGFIRERPGTSILIALGCGFLVGRLLRS